jgi:hypothetical protein
MIKMSWVVIIKRRTAGGNENMMIPEKQVPLVQGNNYWLYIWVAKQAFWLLTSIRV